MKRGHIFNKPAGPSEIKPGRFGWHNQIVGTTRALICELCGTHHPERELGEEVTIGLFLGLQYIDLCCGRAVDQLYEEFGEVFVLQYLKEFADDPTGPEFTVFVAVLKETLLKAGDKLSEVKGQVDSCSKALEKS